MDDDELCSRAVKSIPNIIAVSGLSSPERSSMKPSLFAMGAMADFIMDIPTKSMPKPMRNSPIYLMRECLTNRYIIVPAKSMKGAYAEILNAVICAVIVVPMLAPMMTPIA